MNEYPEYFQGLVVGKSLKRVDGPKKVRGEPMFTSDLRFANMLHCHEVRSEHAHAEILAIDTQRAKKYPGVVGIFTARDVIGENTVGIIVPDQPVFAQNKVCHFGDVLALVVAGSLDIARKASSLIEVEYRPLPGVFDAEDAMRPDSPLVHSNRKYGNRGNIHSEMGFSRGDVGKGFDEADIIVKKTYRPGYQEHAFVETEQCIASSDGDQVSIYGSLQCPFYVRDAVARALGIKRSKVRVIQVAVGGAFGGKEDVPSELAARTAIGAYHLRRSLLTVRSREESMTIHTKRHPMVIHHELGAKMDGTLIAARVNIISDQGAYASVGKYVQKRAVTHALGPYNIPNVKVDSSLVYTNNILTGAFRGFGGPQVAIAAELQMDELAKRTGLDPLELRYRNILTRGDSTPRGQLLDNCGNGLRECIEKAVERSSWKKRRVQFDMHNKECKRNIKEGNNNNNNINNNVRKGIGMATIMYGVGLGDAAPDMATATCQITEDSSVILTTGGVEMGQGAKTVLSQIAAEEIGVPLNYINILDADTSRVQNSGPSVASRVTSVIGEATRRAAAKAAQEIYALAKEKLDCKHIRPLIIRGVPYFAPSGVDKHIDKHDNKHIDKHDNKHVDKQGDKHVDKQDNNIVAFKKIVEECYFKEKKLLGVGHCNTPTKLDEERYRDYYTYSFACHIAEVEVDVETGVVDVKKITAANDVGRAINPLSVEGQIEGGAVQGMGYATMEELVTHEGKILNPSFTDYLIPTALDAPDVDALIVEERDNFGPFGAKGIGEPSLIPTPAAVLNAIGHAIGVAIRKTPASPENVWKTLKTCGKH